MWLNQFYLYPATKVLYSTCSLSCVMRCTCGEATTTKTINKRSSRMIGRGRDIAKKWSTNRLRTYRCERSHRKNVSV